MLYGCNFRSQQAVSARAPLETSGEPLRSGRRPSTRAGLDACCLKELYRYGLTDFSGSFSESHAQNIEIFVHKCLQYTNYSR